jgi:hypothetical protein
MMLSRAHRMKKFRFKQASCQSIMKRKISKAIMSGYNEREMSTSTHLSCVTLATFTDTSSPIPPSLSIDKLS